MTARKAKPTASASRVRKSPAQQQPDGSGLFAAGKGLDSFVNFQHKMGVGTDNVLTSSTYGFNPITRNRIMLEWIHRGSWLGGVAVNVVASDMTRAGIEYATELPAEASDRMDEKAVELGIWTKLEETVQWGRLYGGAIAVALVEGQDMRSPLDITTVGPGQFKGLITLDRWMLEPSLEDLVTEMGPTLGLPRFYRVNASAPALRNQVIHHTRVMLRHVGAKLPYQQAQTEMLWGTSVFERLYDRMVSYDLASTGAAQLVTRAWLRTMKVKGLREVAAAGGPAMEGLAKYTDFMRRMQGIEGMSMIDADDELQIDQHQAFSGLADAMGAFGEQLSGALEIPLIRLFGQSPGGFSDGEGNLRNYYDHIRKSQNSEMRVGVTKVYRMMAQSEGIELPPDFKIEFASLWQMAQPEKIEAAKQLVEAVMAAYEGGLITQQAAMRELRQQSRVFGVFTNITEEDIAQADDQLASMPTGQDAMLGALGTPGQPGGPGGAKEVPPGLPAGFGPEHAANAGNASPTLPKNVPAGLPEGFGPEFTSTAPTAPKPKAVLPEGFGPRFIDPMKMLPKGFGPQFIRKTNDGKQTPATSRQNGRSYQVHGCTIYRKPVPQAVASRR